MTTERRRRDSAQTRQDLLDVARNRFARHGYAATTVRDIADEARVNVALINRYFTSKEGLFRACLTFAASDVSREETATGPAEIAARLAHRLGSSLDDRRQLDALLLLIRTSGDERIDDLRRSVLRSLSEKLAPGGSGEALLRSQIVLAAAVGISLMRAALDLQPIASATEDDLREPLTDLIQSLLR
ncbi:TetR family transcriptional regulator [Actinoplanes sp. TRM 88003]|uniref:TetR family transcriptional regulator n=1 Tax=Paractinoplanes aksuensis TaxID=2939490 RepID=A0ABT1E5I1_9ACTN|nr:TetR/AcrR family transcriptional regulator [Actinoplanes aksuensis]MCO8277061.1 TetR family transcriptional regulator [Actinoplanes aksuensis]